MKKEIFKVLVLAMVIITLAGCGRKDTDTLGKQTTEEGAVENPEKEDTITLKVFDSHAYGLDEYAEMVAKYEEEHPGVKIEVQHVANDSNAILQSRMNAGDFPDVFDVESGTSAKEYYEYAYDWSNDTQILDKFNKDAIDTGRDDAGNVMSLPWTYENMGLIYNKDLFEKAGITELPTTMDDLEEACIKLNDAGITAFALPAKELWVLGQLTTHFMIDKSMDEKTLVEKVKNGEIKFTDMKNFPNLFRFLDLAVKYGPNKPLEVDWETSENVLANGEAAMIHMGDWCQSTLDKFNPDANLAFLPFPVGDNAEDTTLLSSCNWTYIVNKNSEHLDLAKDYCEYILSSNMGLYWMCEGVGAVSGAKTDREVKGALANDAKIYISEQKTDGWIHTIAPTGYTDLIGPLLQAYMTGDVSADEVTTELQNFWCAD